MFVQSFHLGQVPEGSVRQFADAVSLQLEDFQAGQTLEGQTLHLTYAVPVQLTAKEELRRKQERIRGISSHSKASKYAPRCKADID